MTEQVENSAIEHTQPQLVKDDKNIITQVAFTVDESLLGKQLATPTQRGVAIAVDAFFVAMLTNVSGIFWGLFAGIAFFKAGKKQQNKSWRLTRWFLRMIGAFVVFVTVLAIVESFIDDYDPLDKSRNNAEQNGRMLEGTGIREVAKVGKFTKDIFVLKGQLQDGSSCDFNCAKPLIDNTIHSGFAVGMTNQEVLEAVTEVLGPDYFSSQSVDVNYLGSAIEKLSPNNPKSETGSKIEDPQEIKPTEPELIEQIEQLKAENRQLINQEVNYSLVDFAMTQIEDLGLGFGWAALYFTAFSAWWRGQTPGKKLMGIRVIQLDGSYMSAWESFGRYGGYGAGFATGLLGFIQVLWDSNRQAIQDKISATVVIKGDL